MTPAETLGVAPGASEAEVRKAYARAVRSHPPDRDPDAFMRVRAAYELLCDRTRPVYASPHVVAAAPVPPTPRAAPTAPAPTRAPQDAEALLLAGGGTSLGAYGDAAMRLFAGGERVRAAAIARVGAERYGD